MAKWKKKKSQKKKAEKHEAEFKKRIYDFLKNYGSPEQAQEASEAATDSQIRCITTPIAHLITINDTGTILDVGCGKGIILSRLANVACFEEKQGWGYIGTDFQELLNDILHLAIDYRIHKKVDVIPLDDFYDEWPTRTKWPGPHIVIIRNVFHELGIDSSARLLSHIRKNIESEDTVIIQDLSVFPKAEKGNVCWIPTLFDELLREFGLETSLTEDKSSTGNRWFTIIANASSKTGLSLDEVKEKVIEFRTRQLSKWKTLGGLYHDDEMFRDLRFAKIDFDLQVGALILQLQDVASDVSPLNHDQEVLIYKETFEKSLHGFIFQKTIGEIVFKEASRHFRDRANSLNGVVDFMTSEYRITTVTGATLMGKTELLRHFLYGEGFKHDRVPVFVDIRPTASVWNLLDSIFSAIGCRIPIDALQKLREITFTDVRTSINDFFHSIAGRIVCVFDHFENILDSSGRIFDRDIKELLFILLEPEGAKVVITSRLESIDLSFVPEFFVYPKPQPPVGRFPRGEHVENVLQSFLLRPKYPAVLIDAIDRHPFLTTLAGMYLQKYGESALEDYRLLDDLKLQMRDAIFSRIVDDKSRPAVEAISRLRIPVPRKMLVQLSSEKSVFSAEDIGVIRPHFGGGRGDLIGCIGALQIVPSEYAEQASEDVFYSDLDTREKGIERDAQENIVKCYAQLYREDDDPIWLREMYYHRMVIGGKESLGQFGTLYRSELFSAGEYWYDKEKDFDKALWAYNLALEHGQPGYYIRMRIASCKVRLGLEKKDFLNEGDKEFQSLLKRYPSEYGIKMAYVDASLWIKNYTGALKLLREFGFSYTDHWWIAGQFGRAYSGRHEHNKAIAAFEYQLKEKPKASVYEQIARAYHRLGDTDKEIDKIVKGIKKYPNNIRLRLCYGALLERVGEADQAVEVLEKIFEDDPNNGWVIFPLIRSLARIGRIDDIIEIWRRIRYKTRPEFLRIPIEAEILARQERFEQALSVLSRASDDEHKVGQSLEIYFAWANSQTDDEERKHIAKTGLSQPIDPIIQRNVPVLIMRCNLALIAKDRERCEEAINTINTINPHLRELERIKEEYRETWDN